VIESAVPDFLSATGESPKSFLIRRINEALWAADGGAKAEKAPEASALAAQPEVTAQTESAAVLDGWPLQPARGTSQKSERLVS
jgi:hypothetical protein